MLQIMFFPLYITKCTGNPSTTRLDFQDFAAFKKSFGAYNRKEEQYQYILHILLVISSKTLFVSIKMLKIQSCCRRVTCNCPLKTQKIAQFKSVLLRKVTFFTVIIRILYFRRKLKKNQPLNCEDLKWE